MSEQAKHLETTQKLTREDLVNAYQQLYKGDLTGETPEQMLAQKLSEAGDYTTQLIKFAQQHYPDFSGTPAEMEDEVSSHEDIASVDVVFDLLNELQSRLETDRSKNITTIPLPIVAIPPNEYLIKLKEKPNLETTKKYEFQLQERLKILYDTLLLLGLSQPEDFQLYEGQVTATMMRQTPYIIADIETLNRLVCICNEVGNKTFVFDRSQIIKQFGEDEYVETIANSTKNNLKNLIEQSAQDNTSGIIGTGFVWGKTAASKLAALISGSKEFNLESLQSREKQPKKELDAGTIYLTPGPDGLAEYIQPDGTKVVIGTKHAIAKKMGYTQASSKHNKSLIPISENIIFNKTTGPVAQLYYLDPEIKRIPDHVKRILEGDENNIAQIELDGKTVHVGPLNSILKSFSLKVSRTSSADFEYAFLDPTIIMLTKNGVIVKQLYVKEKIAAHVLEKLKKWDEFATLESETYDQMVEADDNGVGTITLQDGQTVHISSATIASKIKGYSSSYLSSTNKELADASRLSIPGQKIGLKLNNGQITTDIYILEKIPNKIDTNQIILQANQDGTAKIHDDNGNIITIGSKSTISKFAGYNHLYLSRNPEIAEKARLLDTTILLAHGNHHISELYVLERLPNRDNLNYIYPDNQKLGTVTFDGHEIHLGAITNISSLLGKANTFIADKKWLQQMSKYPDSILGLKHRTGATTDLYVLEWAQEAIEKYTSSSKYLPNNIELDAQDLALIESRKQQVLLEKEQRKNTEN